MLLFILRKQTEARNGTQISKHLMLLFIKLKKLYELYATKFQNISCYCLSFLPRIQTFDLRDFKTSHVIVYLLSVCSFDRKYFISKHLMLLFIKYNEYSVMGANKFQNISCYCLSGQFRKISRYDFISKHLMLLFIDILFLLLATSFYFKTSHVIVYPPGQTDGMRWKIFQNISCYCLSLAFPRFLVSPLPFFPLYFLYFSIFYQPTPLS